MKIRIVEISEGYKKFYKVQEKHLFYWVDAMKNIGMNSCWPKFESLEDAEAFVKNTYLYNEKVVKEYEF